MGASNTTLRRLMAEYGFSQTALAEEISIVSVDTGTPVVCTGRQVRRFLAGNSVWPHARYRAPLERIFGRPAVELGFIPPRSYRSNVGPNPAALLQEPPMFRRQFVLGLTGTLLTLPQLPAAGRLGISDIERIRETANQLQCLDDEHGGAQIADAAGRYFEYVQGAARRCTYGGSVQTRLHQTLGELAAFAGWCAFDAGRQEVARRWFDTGLRYALLARDSTLQARIWSSMSRQACDLGHSGEAVAIARAALDATRDRRDPRLSALLHTRVALGHSLSGEPGRSGQSLHRAEQELDRAHGTPEPWLAFCGPEEITGQAALCSYNLGRYQDAVRYDETALAHVRGSSFQRNEFAIHVSLTRGLFTAGRIDEALASAHHALDLLPVVQSPRWGVHLTAFRDDVRTVGSSEGADFIERYEVVVT